MSFFNNSGTNYGGVLKLDQGTNIIMEDIVIKENFVEYYTGAFFFSIAKGVVLKNILLYNNSA